MSIVRDNCDERQIRVDRMVDVLRKAQSRRLAKAATVKGDGQAVELQRDAHGQAAAVAGSTATPASR